MTAAALARSEAESEQRALLGVIHANIERGVMFTAEHPAIREMLEARQIAGTNRVGAAFRLLAQSGHLHRIGYCKAARPEAAGRTIAAWEWQ